MTQSRGDAEESSENYECGAMERDKMIINIYYLYLKLIDA